MLVGIIICAIIAALALYDYFSTRSWQVVTSDERNDSVFENRNKAYGAYQIRRDYNKRMILILFGLTAGVGGLYGASLGIHHQMHKKPGDTISVGPLETDDEKPDDKPEETKPIDKPAEPSQAQTYKFLAPEFTELEVKDTFNIPDPSGEVGLKDLKGKDPFAEPPLVDVIPTKTIDNDQDSLGVSTKVTETAYFKGGREALIKYLTNAIDPNLEGEGTCKLKFIVGADGSITKVWITKKVIDCPECDKEAEQAVKKMPKWEPGKSNGTPVNSYFYLPISFR